MSSQPTAHQLRAKVLAYQVHLTPAGYPPRLREELSHYARIKRADGLTWRAIAEEVGVSSSSLATWSKETTSQAFSSLVPVVVTEETSASPPPPLSIVSPHGFRLEGISLQQATQLLGILR